MRRQTRQAKQDIMSVGGKEENNDDDKNDLNVGIQVGKTKVFLSREAYDLLEKLRRQKISSSAVVLQKTARRFV